MNINERNEVGAWVDERMATLGPRGDWEPDAMVAAGRLRISRLAKTAKSRHLTWGAGIVTMLCLCLPAFSVTRALASRCVEACVGATSRVGRLLLPPSGRPAFAGIAVDGRNALPEVFFGETSHGPLYLGDLRGRVVLVNFWATWCAPCKVEIPWFNEFQTRYRDQGLTVVGIALDDEGWAAVRPFATQQQIGYPVAVANDAVTSAFGGITALPATFIVDRQGRVGATHIGLVERAEYEREIEALLTEPATP
jgi:thiol-disulfide isomerase/thioredoxin